MEPIIKYTDSAKYWIVPRFSYELAGEVLISDHYWTGPMADISPVDLSIGWGYLVHPKIQKHLVYDHGNRFYTWRFAPGTPREIRRGRAYIITHSSNNHLIPANETIEHALKNARDGDNIRLKGYLVDVHKFDKKSGQRTAKLWKTSVHRRDHGASGCEIMFVHEARINNRLYQSDFNSNLYRKN